MLPSLLISSKVDDFSEFFLYYREYTSKWGDDRLLEKPVAIQLYTLRNEPFQDFAALLSTVAQIGFTGVEFAEYWGEDAHQTRRILDKNGLRTTGSHVPFEMLETRLEAVIADQHILGSSHITCPILPEQYLRSIDDYKHGAEQLNRFGKRCKDAGITFSYHHHDFELRPLDRQIPLDVIFTETNSEYVQVELDVYWLQKAGEDPLDWLKKYADRTPLVHVKDMDASGQFAPLGTGGVDVADILVFGEKQLDRLDWWIFEQDESTNALHDAKRSLQYLYTL
ncbi:sugar phosphate isomerase/epimerase family protein [Geomicrobium sp. JSM 1781026]|uniref:sugar phosphate isomerase/epimerase family protein n=1 Tax=Geomicrobium sp. JSM 1781026 TaxID=3344580 RepID=UPI0035BF8B54